MSVREREASERLKSSAPTSSPPIPRRSGKSSKRTGGAGASKGSRKAKERTRVGYLLKLGEVNKNWKLRWFQLEHHQLWYFKDADASKPLNHIDLDEAVIRKSAKDIGKENCFEIVTRHRVYYLVAKSADEMNDWMKALNQRTPLTRENEVIEAVDKLICDSETERCRGLRIPAPPSGLRL